MEEKRRREQKLRGLSHAEYTTRESSRNAEEVKVNSGGIGAAAGDNISPRRSENSIRLMENRLYYNPVHSLVHRAMKSIAELKSNHFTKLQPRPLKIHFRHFC